MFCFVFSFFFVQWQEFNIKLGQLCKQVKDNMCNYFLDFWNGERVDAIGSNRGKLDTYFYIKTHFGIRNIYKSIILKFDSLYVR